MFANLKGLFNPSNKDLRKRILFTLGCLAIFALGTNIIVPGAKEITKNLGFLELLNLMSGGSLKSFSIFALGVMPYITATIITQLLQMDIIPYFKELKEQGATGRQKLNRINRYLGILFALIQGYVFSIAFLGDAGTFGVVKTTIYLTAGTALLLWLGDQITKKGIGNGVSLIIMAGIVNTLPSTFITAFDELILAGTFSTWTGIILFALFVIVYLAIIIGVIYMQLAERRIPIQYANKSVSTYQSNNSYLPFKLNSAGVMPVIFASGVISLPSMMASLMGSKYVGFQTFVNKWLSTSSYTGFILYMIFIIIFAYFYTFKVAIKTDEMAKNLNRNGGFIPGIRPGKETEEYVSKVLKRVTFVGALTLCVIAGLPVIFGVITKLPSAVSLGGTGMLIVVGVALETYKQIESTILSRNYETRNRRRRKI